MFYLDLILQNVLRSPFHFRYTQIHDWESIPIQEIQNNYSFNIFDSLDQLHRCYIANLHNFPLLDDYRIEIPIFIDDGDQILCREPIINPDEAQCGMLIDFLKI